MDTDRIFAIDFTSVDMTAAFVSPDGLEEGTAGFDLADFQAGESDPLDKLITLLMAKARVDGRPYRAAAVTLPCDLDAERKHIINFPQAAWLNDTLLPEVLQGVLNVPVVMERRAVAMLAYDRVMLGLPEDSLILGCYVDMHYDSAFWVHGGPVLGRNGAAGNIAHMTIHDREDLCFCGKAGCVDLYGAGVRLNQLHTMIFPDTPLDELFVRHGDHPIVVDYLSMMAYPIAIEANVLDPEFLIIGGQIPGMRGFPRSVLEEAVVRLGYRPESGASTYQRTVLPSTVTPDTGRLCASMFAREKLTGM
ncbi:MAG: ROK family protein [Planctomycetaceae bacterium]|nr:ROK family protein [Planctomycetaceae bacterium]